MKQKYLILCTPAIILGFFFWIIIIPDSLAVNPIPSREDAWWKEMFNAQCNEISDGECNLFLAGDSITMRFETSAPHAWNRYILPHHPIIFGIDGDQTWDLLYRLKNAPLNQISPDLCTILIGINDIIRGEKPEIVAERIHEIAIYLATQYPGSQILLFHIFPAENNPGPIRRSIDETNEILSGLSYPDNVRVLSINDKFLNHDGTLNDSVLPDQLHISQKGYDIWGTVIHNLIRNQTRTGEILSG